MADRWDRLRRWSPALVGALLGLLGVVALGVASLGLTVTVSPPAAPSTEVDPLVLLREDQAATSEQVRDLGLQLQELVRALGAASAAEDAARARGTATTTLPAGAPVTELAAPRGVFSFRAASQGVDLDERQRFEVISSLSRVGFDAQSTMHDFSGVTQDVSGWVEARLADPGQDGRGQIVARAATLRTGIDGRDEEMRERLLVEEHPELRFDWTGFEVDQVDRATSAIRGTALGTLTVRGVARQVRVPVRVEVDPQRRLLLAGEVVVKMSDFGVDPPNLGVIRVKDEVKVWLSLRLRSLGRAEAP